MLTKDLMDVVSQCSLMDFRPPFVSQVTCSSYHDGPTQTQDLSLCFSAFLFGWTPTNNCWEMTLLQQCS